jgi:hypothetical protein
MYHQTGSMDVMGGFLVGYLCTPAAIVLNGIMAGEMIFGKTLSGDDLPMTKEQRIEGLGIMAFTIMVGVAFHLSLEEPTLTFEKSQPPKASLRQNARSALQALSNSQSNSEGVGAEESPSLSSTFGIKQVEAVNQGLMVGKLENGATVSVRIATEGETATVTIFGAYSDMSSVPSSGTFQLLYKGAMNVAKQLGASKLTLQGGFTNDKVSSILKGFRFTETTLKLGKENLPGFEKTIDVK